MLPSHKTTISIRTRDTRCLISTCKISANLPYKSRGVDHRIGHGSHAEKRQSPQASFPSDTLDRNVREVADAVIEAEKGYGIWESLQPTHKPEWLQRSDPEIILAYNAEMRGFAHSYTR